MSEREKQDWMTRTSRFEFKTDPQNECLIGPDGCHYDSEARAMYFDQLKLCGCGMPSEVHRVLAEAASCFDRDKVGWSPETGVTGVAEIVKANPDVVAEFIGHFLEDRALLEHGSSVYGSWLTERGKQFVEIGVHEDIADDH